VSRNGGDDAGHANELDELHALIPQAEHDSHSHNVHGTAPAALIPERSSHEPKEVVSAVERERWQRPLET
jgi:hypothetical protein